MDAQETRAYIEHRLATVGWNGDPSFDDGAHAAIYAYSGGIPRKVNTLMDRVLLMGYLEEMHQFGDADIQAVISDISEEFQLPEGQAAAAGAAPDALPGAGLGGLNQELRTLDQRVGERRTNSVEVLDERMMRLEKSIVSVLSILKKIVATPQGAVTQPMDNQE
jgi:hypothetical protein